MASVFFAKDTEKRSDHIGISDLLITKIGLLVQGRVHFSDVELFRQDGAEGFKAGLGLEKIPSESTLRHGIEDLAENSLVTTLTKLEGANLGILKGHRPSAIKVGERQYIPNDIDVTPLDNSGSHRENSSYTYKKHDGFAPIMSNLGAEGWLLHHQLRPGSQHCQKGTPEFLERNFQLLKKLDLDHPVLVRMDAGNDSADTLEVLRESGHAFVVKRNLRKEDPVKWLSLAMAMDAPECPREGKEVYLGSAEHLSPGGESGTQNPLTCIYRVVRRTIDKHGQPLLLDDIEIETYWTNLGEAPADIIETYHDHGTSEQFHSEMKSDLGVERFPSRKYGVNQIIFALAAIAYNVMRVLDQRAMGMKEKWPRYLQGKKTAQLKRRRIGSIMRDLICIAGKVVRHSGRSVLKIARAWPWSAVLLEIDSQLA